MTMTKENRIATIATVAADVLTRNATLTAKYATKAENAQQRIAKVTAFFATDRFATMVVDHGFDLKDIYDRCDKTLDRFVRVIDTLNRDTMQIASDKDQNRYTFNLIRTLVASVNAQVAVKKSDVFATATKVETAPEFVAVSKRFMSESTADRQSGIATFVLEMLGLLTRNRNADGSVEYKVNKNTKVYRKVCKLIASNA
jgi:hypothetical protein